MPTKITNINSDNLIKKYISGVSVKKLAEFNGVSRTVINRILIENNIPTRNRSKAMFTRMSQTSTRERKRLTKAAHEACHGRKHTLSEKIKRAKTRQLRQVGISASETRLVRMLNNRGIETTQQLAIGPYNIDIACNPVAVEIFGGGWHWYGKHLRIVNERFKYILSTGWDILVINITNEFPLNKSVADYVVSYIQSRRSDKALIREYRVVRGAGEFIAGGSINDNEISIVPAFTRGRDSLGRYTRVPR